MVIKSMSGTACTCLNEISFFETPHDGTVTDSDGDKLIVDSRIVQPYYKQGNGQG